MVGLELLTGKSLLQRSIYGASARLTPARQLRQIGERANLAGLVALEWRNWQTRRTQNPVGLTPRVGSTPTSSTMIFATSLGTEHAHGSGEKELGPPCGFPSTPLGINDSHLQHHDFPRVSLLGGRQQPVSAGRLLPPTPDSAAGPGKTDASGRSRSLSGSKTGRRFRAPRPPAAPSHQWEWERCCPARA